MTADMRIICVDDDRAALERTADMLKGLMHADLVEAFEHPREALDWLGAHAADVAFLDIAMPDMDGIALAGRMREMCPAAVIVFLTAHREFAYEAFSVRPSGYLLKPADRAMLQRELDHVLEQRRRRAKGDGRVVVRTFGGFDVFVDGETLRFKRSRAKEALAYLIDSQGRSVRRADIFAALWEDVPYGHAEQKYLDVIIRSMRDTLRQAGISEILEMKGGCLRIRPEYLDCDLYRYLEGDETAVGEYHGVYMSDYSWAELSNGRMSLSDAEHRR